MYIHTPISFYLAIYLFAYIKKLIVRDSTKTKKQKTTLPLMAQKKLTYI